MHADLTLAIRRIARQFGATAAIALSAACLSAPVSAEPRQPAIRLFNGRDLTGFTTWLAGKGRQDPDGAFSVANVDGVPAIRISGQGFGGLITVDEYRDFILDAEFRWSGRTWAPRERNARDSGIVVRCTGPEGSASRAFDSPWMRGLEFQVIEGGTGDFILIPGYDRDGSLLPVRMSATVAPGRDAAGQATYQADGNPAMHVGGRIDWYGRDPGWTDTIGFRGSRDVERPVGQWNHVRVICDGGTVTAMVNGRVVNRGAGCNLTGGRILFQCEGAEIYYRGLVIRPL